MSFYAPSLRKFQWRNVISRTNPANVCGHKICRYVDPKGSPAVLSFNTIGLPSRSGRVVYSTVLLHGWSCVRTSPMFVDTRSVSTWIKKPRLPFWSLHSQQVSDQAWIWGSHKWQSMQGIHPGFENHGRHHQKSKTGVLVAPQKGLMSSKIIKNLRIVWCSNNGGSRIFQRSGRQPPMCGR